MSSNISLFLELKTSMKRFKILSRAFINKVIITLYVLSVNKQRAKRETIVGETIPFIGYEINREVRSVNNLAGSAGWSN